MDSDIDLGGGYYYVQDYPQCICHYPKPGKVILPIGECDDIVVRVQYNDSIIIATSTPSYYAPDSTVYEIRKETNSIRIISDGFPNTDKKVFKEIKNSKRYCSPPRNPDGLKMDKN